MGSSNKRRSLVSAALLAALASAPACRDDQQPEPAAQTEATRAAPSPGPSASPEAPVAVATLLDPSADVQVRGSQELIWKAGTDHMPLADKDAVKTGQGATAWVRFNDLTSLKMDELSMMIIVGRGKKSASGSSSVALASGRLNGKLDPDPERPVELEVRTARGWIRASTKAGKRTSTQFNVALSPKGALEVKNESGDVSVVTQGHEQKVKAHETFTAEAPESGPPRADAAMKEPPALAQGEWKVTPDPGYEPPPPPKAPPPKRFQVLSPAPRAVIESETVNVEGILGGTFKAYLDDHEITAGPDGHFSVPYHLKEGRNVLRFRIVTKGGASGEELEQSQTLEVTRKK